MNLEKLWNLYREFCESDSSANSTNVVAFFAWLAANKKV